MLLLFTGPGARVAVTDIDDLPDGSAVGQAGRLVNLDSTAVDLASGGNLSLAQGVQTLEEGDGLNLLFDGVRWVEASEPRRILKVTAAALADAFLEFGQMCASINESSGALTLKVKDSDGTVTTYTIAKDT